MLDSLPLSYLQIAVAGGHNQLESAKQELHLSLRQLKHPMEKLSQQ
jgi:hypothetical protein